MAGLKNGNAAGVYQMSKKVAIETHAPSDRNFERAIVVIGNPYAVEAGHSVFRPFSVGECYGFRCFSMNDFYIFKRFTLFHFLFLLRRGLFYDAQNLSSWCSKYDGRRVMYLAVSQDAIAFRLLLRGRVV